MIRSGIVTQVSRIGKCGVIQDANKREFFFIMLDCNEGELPVLHSIVTFMKDTDYKATDVAIDIQPSPAFKKIG